jgi:hypothetical protein
MSDIVLPELASAVYADRVRDAKKTHRFLAARISDVPVLILKRLLLLFAHS